MCGGLEGRGGHTRQHSLQLCENNLNSLLQYIIITYRSAYTLYTCTIIIAG